MSIEGLERVAVALDTSDREEFDRWCRFFGPRVGVLKVGLECFVRLGPAAVAVAREHARRLFLDLKLHDIPNTVAGASAAARGMGADLLTVHASGGRSMLEAAVRAAPGVEVLAVTLLTHLGTEDLRELGFIERRWSENPVQRLANVARTAGCAGVVSSPRELETLRPVLPPPFLLVTPGIRPAGAGPDDQRRIASPAEAVAGGADVLVIGRPLTRAPDQGEALDRLAREIADADDRTTRSPSDPVHDR
jgi:orotidine-5'-phosphate decarboxylase